MRKDQHDREKGRVKFRLIEFEMDAGDPALQDTMRQLTGAIGRGPTGRPLDVNPQLGAPEKGNSSAKTGEPNDGADGSDNQLTPPDNGGSSTGSRTSKPARPRSPKIVPDLQLRE